MNTQIKKVSFNIFKRDVIIYMGYNLTLNQMILAYNIYSKKVSEGIYPAVQKVINKK